MSPNSSLTRDAGQVTRQPPSQSQSQQQLYEGVTAQHPPAAPVSRLTDLTSIPEVVRLKQVLAPLTLPDKIRKISFQRTRTKQVMS
eukprot:445013-Amphidinium_carterae.1